VVVVGAALVLAGLAASSFGNRSRYRPDRWSGREWVTVAVAAAALAAVVIAGRDNTASLSMPVYPLALPAVPPLALAGLLLAALPSFVAPAPVEGASR
jgi:energy-coupling factor transport system permease protein